MPQLPRPTVCPSCGGRLQFIPDGLIGRPTVPGYFVIGRSTITTVWSRLPFLACTACEFCKEILNDDDAATR